MAKQIIVSGDSYVEGVGDNPKYGGWASRLATRLKDTDMTIHGIGGQTVKDLADRFEQEIASAHNAIVIYEIGTNDSRIRANQNNTHEVELHDFLDTYRAIIQKTKQQPGVNRVVLIGLALVKESDTSPYREDKIYKNDYSRKYDDAIRELAQSMDVDYIPLRESICPQAGTIGDGLHPNPRGHQTIAGKVYEYLSKRMEQ